MLGCCELSFFPYHSREKILQQLYYKRVGPAALNQQKCIGTRVANLPSKLQLSGPLQSQWVPKRRHRKYHFGLKTLNQLT